MRTTEEFKRIYKQCIEECIETKIPIRYKSVKCVFPKAMRKWGNALIYRNTNPPTFDITINENLYVNGDVKALKETVLHELLHTAEYCFNHGDTFQVYAQWLNQKYGYNIGRTNSENDKGIFLEENPRFIFRCCGCNRVFSKAKKSKFTANYQHYHCGICGGKFEKIYERGESDEKAECAEAPNDIRRIWMSKSDNESCSR